MKLKNCEYCGTEYNEDLTQCPLCGKSAAEAADARMQSQNAGKRGGARVAPKKTKKAKRERGQDRIPQWMWAVICVILGLAVLIGLVYFLISMGYIGEGREAQAPATSVMAPEVDSVNEPDLLEPIPEEVEPVDLSCKDLTLSQTGIVFDVKGSSVFLTAVPTPLDCTDPITFSTADETVATVESNGMITAVGYGQTEITAACGSITATCIIVCDFQDEEETTEPEKETEPDTETEEDPDPESEEEEPEEVAQPELSSEDFTLFRPGEETTISVKNAPDGANITYVSSNPDVVTVSGTGKVKAVGNGVATITVTVNDLKLTCVARCNLGTTAENTGGDTGTSVIGTLSLSHTDVSLFSLGEAFTLSLHDSDGNQASGVSWSTSNGGVCSVDANGRVTGLGTGTATITGSYNGQSYSCIVRCNF